MSVNVESNRNVQIIKDDVVKTFYDFNDAKITLKTNRAWKLLNPFFIN